MRDRPIRLTSLRSLVEGELSGNGVSIPLRHCVPLSDSPEVSLSSTAKDMNFWRACRANTAMPCARLLGLSADRRYVPAHGSSELSIDLESASVALANQGIDSLSPKKSTWARVGLSDSDYFALKHHDGIRVLRARKRIPYVLICAMH